MANFAENLLKEYQRIIKRTTPTKDVFYRIRVVERKVEGIMTRLLDIRQYNVTEKRFGFTESGVYFTKQELGVLISELQKAQKEFFYGSNQDNRGQDTFSNSETE